MEQQVIETVAESATKLSKLQAAKLLFRKVSPELALGVGIVSIVAGTVVAVKRTPMAKEAVEDMKVNLGSIKDMYEDESIEDYGDKEYKKDLVYFYTRGFLQVLKAYAPAIGLQAGGVMCVLSSHGMMRKRNAAISTAFNALNARFSAYRDTVREDVGEETERKYNETTAEKLAKRAVSKLTPEQQQKLEQKGERYSRYTRWFDSASPNWEKDSEMNLMFLRAQQNYMNDLLKVRGHVFLNDVYDALGLPRSQEGAVVGWVLGPNNENCVDFGLYDIQNKDAVNTYEKDFLLDFNVDGVVYNQI